MRNPLNGIYDFVIEDNRRSTKEIIDVLNKVRTSDLTQNCLRDISNIKPAIIVGDMNKAILKAKELCNGNRVVSLSRDNVTSNAMKREINGAILNPKLLDELIFTDKPSSSNGYRSKVVKACIKSLEFAREKRFKDAIREMSKEFKFKSDKTKEKRVALKNIRILLNKYDEIKSKSLYEFYSMVQQHIKPSISNMRAGRIKTFYEDKAYQDLALCVKIPEDESDHKTIIHKAKGDEFENVLVVLKDESELQFILSSNLESDEEHRINYVAVSRAKEKLFISTPSLSTDNEQNLMGLFNVIRL